MLNYKFLSPNASEKPIIEGKEQVKEKIGN